MCWPMGSVPPANPLPPPLQSLIETQRVEASKLLDRALTAQRLGIDGDVSRDALSAAINVLSEPPDKWGHEPALDRLDRQWGAFASANLSEADKDRLAAIRARQAARTAKYERRQARRPAALFARLCARAARVSWDSWG